MGWDEGVVVAQGLVESLCDCLVVQRVAVAGLCFEARDSCGGGGVGLMGVREFDRFGDLQFLKLTNVEVALTDISGKLYNSWNTPRT
jgi:hypothetical protein